MLAGAKPLSADARVSSNEACGRLFQRIELAFEETSARDNRAITEIGIETGAVDHADEADVADPHLHGATGRRDDARAMRAGDKAIFRNGKSRKALEGMAPPQGLILLQGSTSSTDRPAPARSSAAIAPLGPPPITATSNNRASLVRDRVRT